MFKACLLKELNEVWNLMSIIVMIASLRAETKYGEMKEEQDFGNDN